MRQETRNKTPEQLKAKALINKYCSQMARDGYGHPLYADLVKRERMFNTIDLHKAYMRLDDYYYQQATKGSK